MNAETASMITAAISVIGAITTITSILISRKKVNAEAEEIKAKAKKTENEAYLMLIKPLEDSITKLNSEVESLKLDLKISVAHNILLTDQLCQEGISPAPAPKTCEEATKIIRAKKK